MSLSLMRKLLPPKKMWTVAGTTMQVRHHAPIAGPPRFPMSPGQKLIMGGGSILVMMIIPFWALFQVPRWSKLHNGIEEEVEEKEQEEAAPPEKEPPPPKDEKNEQKH
ncbi:GL26603 [Drosophila persimilis]|uniref:Uncharacterized protein n=2 Tax=pseudoobscura subgroup TaxID=32358 RepID=Q29KT6_DROPS|nr:uncharacterized protein LOC4816470 [Drosophila pseudoobscura]XP_002021609.1 uncharacterized protein LOC6596613 [Drosophila persimilis]EDW25452.1 GL26603 [Drosophila persimilis]